MPGRPTDARTPGIKLDDLLLPQPTPKPKLSSNAVRLSMSALVRSWMDAPAGLLAPRQIKVQCSGAATDRMGDIVVQSRIDLGPFKNSPTVLWNHDPAFPIARALWIGLENGSLCSIAQFPPEGTEEASDRVYKLIKADVPLDVSIGFMPVESEPINPRDPWDGTRFNRTELLEWSIVSIGAQRDSRVIGKGLRGPHRRDAPSDVDTEAKLARARRAAELRRQVSGLTTVRLTDDRPVDGYITQAEPKEHVALLRARHGLKRLDTRVVRAQSQFRLEGS